MIGILVLLELACVNAADEEDAGCSLRLIRNISNCLKLESFKPWPTDDECKKYNVSIFPEKTFQPTAVAAFANSGRPMFLRMIERSTGVVTGDVKAMFRKFNPETEIRCGVKSFDGKTIVQGTPDTTYRMIPKWFQRLVSYDDEALCWPTLSKVYFNYHGIILIRNPWHVLTVTRVYLQKLLRKCTSCTKLQPKLLETNDFEHNHFKKYFEFGAEQWVDHVKSWVKGSPDGSGLVIIKYEELIKSPEIQLRRALKYLNVTVEDGRLNCVLKDPAKLKDLLYENRLRVTVSAFFERNLDSKASNTLKKGIVEINEILRLKGISEHLDYKRPIHSEFLTRDDFFITRV